MARNQMADIQLRKTLWEDEKRAYDILHESVYTILVGDHDARGVRLGEQELLLDSTPSIVAGVDVQVQDVAGLFSLAVYDQVKFQHLLQSITDSKTALNISMELADWIDEDHTRRFRGMEASNYISQGLIQSPRNAPIRNVSELMELPSMTATIMNGSADKPGLSELMVAGGTDHFNIAVAPDIVLGPVLNLSKGEESKILSAKRQLKWKSMLEMINTQDWIFNDVSPLSKSNRYRFVIHGKDHKLKIQIKLTAYRDNGLFEISEWQIPSYQLLGNL